MRRYIILIALLLLPIIPLVLYVTGVIRPAAKTPSPVALTMWTTSASPGAFAAILKDFNAIRPYITITVEQIPDTNYANALKDAWARGKGPDIFEMPASWVGEFANDFIAPVPKSTSVFTYTTRKIVFRTDVQINQTNVPSITVSQLRSDFADVVSEDVVRSGKIYGLPFALDTLVLYYNKDLLRSANIAQPPSTWTQLIAMAPRLTVADEGGKILQSAIAIGRGSNVNHAADIISLLFLQDGVTMNTDDGLVPIDQSLSDKTNLGVNAVSFYTSFADPTRAVYSWNATQPNSLQAFMRGKTAMYIGYNRDRNVIDANSSVNYEVAPMLHLDDNGKDAVYTAAGNPIQVNYATYNVFSVFQRSKHPQEAWNFIQYVAKQSGEVTKYLGPTRGVGALRSILTKQSADPGFKVFAEQAISARSWYRGRDAGATERALTTMLDNIADGKVKALDGLAQARGQIELTTKIRR